MSTSLRTDHGEGSTEPPRAGRSPAQLAIWIAVAAFGALAWTVLALSRGETVSAL